MAPSKVPAATFVISNGTLSIMSPTDRASLIRDIIQEVMQTLHTQYILLCLSLLSVSLQVVGIIPSLLRDLLLPLWGTVSQVPKCVLLGPGLLGLP